jgi:hypothetical protein
MNPSLIWSSWANHLSVTGLTSHLTHVPLEGTLHIKTTSMDVTALCPISVTGLAPPEEGGHSSQVPTSVAGD